MTRNGNENVCPQCGKKVRIHGGVKWNGGNAEAKAKNYDRVLNETTITETYTCPECGKQWSVTRESISGWSQKDKDRDSGPDDCGACHGEVLWGEATIRPNGKGMSIGYECQECGESVKQIRVFKDARVYDYAIDEGWAGAYDYYPTGRCPRCGSEDIDWGEGYYNADYYAVPGSCESCGLSFQEMSDADVVESQGYDEEATILVRDCDISDEEDEQEE